MTMWRDRLEAELAQERVFAARRLAREAENADWYAAWHTYKAHLTEPRPQRPIPSWWDLTGWVRWLLGLHAPGGTN